MRTDLEQWRALERHAGDARRWHLRELFAADPTRGWRLATEAAGIYVDYSKQRVTDESLRLLVGLAEACGLRAAIDRMYRGDHVNVTEDRPALHVALRAPRDALLVVDGVDVVAAVHGVLDRMEAFAESVRSGTWRGYTGRPIRNVVNLGIGGSDLGPSMAYEALRRVSDRALTFRFVANVDGTDLVEATRDLDPGETLFIVCSKTFTTLETMANAHAARGWLVAGLGDERAVGRHFAAASTARDAVARFGIDPACTFEFWDWVGGRYSMGAAIGLSTMIAIGPDRFREMLSGFHAMDEHFRIAPFERNAPVLMGLLAVWCTSFLGAETIAVVPYEHYLRRFPAYLQQLAMESNGKRVSVSGEAVPYATSPVYWGEPGTNAQHSFFQLLHQGTRLVPCDILVCRAPSNAVGNQHELLLSNALAQGAALAFGRTAPSPLPGEAPDRLAPHRACIGNQPSTTVLLPALTPESLGALVALYEHCVYTQAAVWDINAFDQWGVELGKVLAGRVHRALARGATGPGTGAAADGADVAGAGLAGSPGVLADESEPLDTSTTALIERIGARGAGAPARVQETSV